MTDLSLMKDPIDSIGSMHSSTDPIGFEQTSPRSRWRLLTDPASLLPTYVGVAVAAVGFVLLGVAWAKVAGLVDVWKQMPYLLSAGLPGLGLVMVGLVIINVSARRQDGAARARQMAALTEALRELQRTLR
jgi:hypothetical protein